MKPRLEQKMERYQQQKKAKGEIESFIEQKRKNLE